VIVTGKVLETSAVLDISTGQSIYGQALLRISNQLTMTLAVPMVTYSAAWQASTTDQERLWLDLLLDEDAEPSIVLIPLDAPHARACGLLAAAAGQPGAALGTVHAAQLAIERSWPVVTRTPDEVLSLSPDVRTETIP
jgi:predicted nucleic acid-binding protein